MNQFVEQNTQSPDINSSALLFMEQNLRSHVLVGPADGISSHVFIILGTPPEITQLDVTFSTQEQVFRLDISMNDFVTVDVLDG